MPQTSSRRYRFPIIGKDDGTGQDVGASAATSEVEGAGMFEVAHESALEMAFERLFEGAGVNAFESVIKVEGADEVEGADPFEGEGTGAFEVACEIEGVEVDIPRCFLQHRYRQYWGFPGPGNPLPIIEPVAGSRWQRAREAAATILL